MNKSQDDAVMKFNILLDLAIKDLGQEYENNSKGIFGQRTGIQTLINRFLIKYPEQVLQYVNQTLNVSNDQFFDSWINNMKNLSSRNALKINTVAILNVLPLIS